MSAEERRRAEGRARRDASPRQRLARRAPDLESFAEEIRVRTNFSSDPNLSRSPERSPDRGERTSDSRARTWPRDAGLDPNALNEPLTTSQALKERTNRAAKRARKAGERVGAALRDRSKSAASIIRDRSNSAGRAVWHASADAGRAIRRSSERAGRAVASASGGAGHAVREASRSAGRSVGSASRSAGRKLRGASRDAGRAAGKKTKKAGTRMREKTKAVGRRVRRKSKELGAAIRSRSASAMSRAGAALASAARGAKRGMARSNERTRRDVAAASAATKRRMRRSRESARRGVGAVSARARSALRRARLKTRVKVENVKLRMERGWKRRPRCVRPELEEEEEEEEEAKRRWTSDGSRRTDVQVFQISAAGSASFVDGEGGGRNRRVDDDDDEDEDDDDEDDDEIAAAIAAQFPELAAKTRRRSPSPSPTRKQRRRRGSAAAAEDVSVAELLKRVVGGRGGGRGDRAGFAEEEVEEEEEEEAEEEEDVSDEDDEFSVDDEAMEEATPPEPLVTLAETTLEETLGSDFVSTRSAVKDYRRSLKRVAEATTKALGRGPRVGGRRFAAFKATFTSARLSEASERRLAGKLSDFAPEAGNPAAEVVVRDASEGFAKTAESFDQLEVDLNVEFLRPMRKFLKDDWRMFRVKEKYVEKLANKIVKARAQGEMTQRCFDDLQSRFEFHRQDLMTCYNCILNREDAAVLKMAEMARVYAKYHRSNEAILDSTLDQLRRRLDAMESPQSGAPERDGAGAAVGAGSAAVGAVGDAASLLTTATTTASLLPTLKTAATKMAAAETMTSGSYLPLRRCVGGPDYSDVYGLSGLGVVAGGGGGRRGGGGGGRIVDGPAPTRLTFAQLFP